MHSQVAWITGASTGIGAATALKLAEEGWTVAVTARTAGKLDILCDKDPKFLKSYPGDVTNQKKMREIVERIEKDHGPIDLAIFNAGTYVGHHIEEFTAESFAKQMEINVIGVGNCLDPIAEKFLERKRGHIAITSSIAGYRGLPRSIGYSASKSALINMAESLAIETYGSNIKVQVINPGFVRTPLTDKNDFEMPMLMEVDDAAEALVKGLKSNRFEINFPWIFCNFTRMVGWLPDKLYFWLMKRIKDKRAPYQPPENNDVDEAKTETDEKPEQSKKPKKKSPKKSKKNDKAGGKNAAKAA